MKDSEDSDSPQRHSALVAKELARLDIDIAAQKVQFKTTWRHPQSKHRHLLDYILTQQWDLKDIHHTKVMPSADRYTDHRQVRCKVFFILKSPPKKKGPTEAEFQTKLVERLSSKGDPDADLHKTTAEIVGFSTRKYQVWFDESDLEIQELLEKKRSCYKHLLANPDDHSLKAAYMIACNTLKATLRTMKNDYLPKGHSQHGRYALFLQSTEDHVRTLTPHPGSSMLLRWLNTSNRQGPS
ncbi:hypothetical protein ACOMHN_000759 [Nucella lapillus]